MSSPEVFPNFNKLPSEIRCLVWRKSVPDYRLVPIKYKRQTCSYVPRIGPPVILQVNRESRREGLTIYHELQLGPVPIKDCYVDLTRDIVYLKSNIGIENDQFVAAESVMRNRGRLVSPPRGQAVPAMPVLTHPSTTIEEREEDENPLHGPGTSSRRHSKIIFYDLLTSADGEAILRRFHVNCQTWSQMQKLYIYRRHRVPFHMDQLVLVHERGHGPLKEDIQLTPIQWQEYIAEDSTEEKPPNYDRDRVATKRALSYTAMQSLVNYRDRRAGLPHILKFTVVAKSLDRVE